jgi:putative endonuclease
MTRVWQHREHLADGFSRKHRVTELVWFEQHAAWKQPFCVRNS